MSESFSLQNGEISVILMKFEVGRFFKGTWCWFKHTIVDLNVGRPEPRQCTGGEIEKPHLECINYTVV